MTGTRDGEPNTSVAIAYAIAHASGTDSVTVTQRRGAGLRHAARLRLRIFEIAGVAATAAFDVAQGGSGASSATDGMTTAPLVTSSGDELLFAVGQSWSGGAVAGTGFDTLSTGGGDIAESRFLAAAGSYVPTATMSNGTTWSFLAATLRGQ